MKFLAILPALLAVIGLVQSVEIKIAEVEPPEWRPIIKHKEIFLKVNMTKVVIECEAEYPVQWHYEGVASPMQLHVTSSRKTSDDLKNSTFVTQLRIFRVSAELTGKYVCSNLQGRAKEHIYIFGDGHGYRGVDPILLQYGQNLTVIAEPGKKAVFPCSTWNPHKQIKLYRKTANAHYVEIKFDDKTQGSFNPRKGFLIAVTEENAESLLGTYICTCDLDMTFDRVIVNLVRRPDFAVEPKAKNIEVVVGENLRLACKSKKPVFFRWVDLDKADVQEFNQSKPEHKFPYVITFNASTMVLNDEGSIECVGREDNAVKHTWQFKVISKLDRSRRGWKKFNSKRTGKETYACWSKSSVSPAVSFVNCFNPAECQIRGQCLKKSNKCDPVNTQLCPGGCALLTIINQSGILQCKGDGVDQQIHQFVGISGAHYSNSSTELDVPGQELLKITSTEYDASNNLLLITCKASGMSFMGGIRWGVRATREASGIRGERDLLQSNFEEFLPNGYIQATLSIPAPKTRAQITCYAPKLNSFEWAEVQYSFKEANSSETESY